MSYEYVFFLSVWNCSLFDILYLLFCFVFVCLVFLPVLQLKLQQRRTREELVSQGIMPRTHPHTHTHTHTVCDIAPSQRVRRSVLNSSAIVLTHTQSGSAAH